MQNNFENAGPGNWGVNPGLGHTVSYGEHNPKGACSGDFNGDGREDFYVVYQDNQEGDGITTYPDNGQTSTLYTNKGIVEGVQSGGPGVNVQSDTMPYFEATDGFQMVVGG